MKPAARYQPDYDTEICDRFICEDCPISDDCDYFQNYKFLQEERRFVESIQYEGFEILG